MGRIKDYDTYKTMTGEEDRYDDWVTEIEGWLPDHIEVDDANPDWLSDLFIEDVPAHKAADRIVELINETKNDLQDYTR